MRALTEAPEDVKAPPPVAMAGLPAVRRHGWLVTVPIALILLTAALMRLNRVDQPLTDVFSWRESSTAMMAESFYRRNWNILYPEVTWDGPGPSYQGREFQTVSYLTALLYVGVGQQEWVGRVVAIAFGTWGVFALYRLACRVWDEPRALASAALLAVMPGAVFIDRSFLPDPAMVALATTTLWVWIAYLQTGKRRYLVLTWFVGMWAIASKLPGLLIALPALYAALAMLGWREMLRPQRLLTLSVLVVVTLVPVAAYYLWVAQLSRLYPPYHFAGSVNWVWVDGLQAWWERGYYLQQFAAHLIYWNWTVPVIAMVGISLLFSPAQRQDGAESSQTVAPWLFHWWLAGCAGYYLIGARELTENVWNLHIFNPPAAALAGQSLLLICSIGSGSVRSAPALARIGVILLVIVVASQVPLGAMYNPDHAQDDYEMGLALRDVSAPDELVVTITSDLGDPVAIYYSRRRGWVFPPADPTRWWNRLPDDDAESIRLFEGLRASGARWLGFVRRFDSESWVGHEALLAHFQRTCAFVDEGPGWLIYRVRTPEELRSMGIQ